MEFVEKRKSFLIQLKDRLTPAGTTDGKPSLDETKVFWAVLGALITTILVVGVVWFNVLLLGDFFFVYFLAFITSVSLRDLKNQMT